MKLDAPDGVALVPHAHDFAFFGFRSYLQAIRQGVPFDHKRMVPSGGERIWHPGEEVAAIVFDGRSLAVHHAVIYHHFTAERVADALMPQTNSKQRDMRAEGANDLIGQTGFAR